MNLHRRRIGLRLWACGCRTAGCREKAELGASTAADDGAKLATLIEECKRRCMAFRPLNCWEAQ